MKIVDQNKKVTYDSEAVPTPSPSTVTTTTSVISNSPSKPSSNTIKYSPPTNYSSEFIGKGVNTPSGTGVYKYDSNTGKYYKEGSSNGTTYVDNYLLRETNLTTPTVSRSRDRVKYSTRSSAPILSGSYYKIQMIAVEFYNEDHKRYNNVKDFRKRLDSEYIIEKGWTRVMLADFTSKKEAQKMLEKVRTKGGFKRAYIVKYRDGERIGRVK